MSTTVCDIGTVQFTIVLIMTFFVLSTRRNLNPYFSAFVHRYYLLWRGILSCFFYFYYSDYFSLKLFSQYFRIYVTKIISIFDIFMNHLFLSISKSKVCISADDNTLYSCNEILEHLFSDLKCGLRDVLDWFKTNSVKTFRLHRTFR